ncbi:MAG: AAA family ATPase [Alphaproteobacteria bacterium]|nr:AAA family ATPase [Alphaproteobacteria bacterium]
MNDPRKVALDATEPIGLTRRQRQILDLLRAGKSNKEIAFALGIGLGTVKQHMVALFDRMGVANRTMAVSRSFTPRSAEAAECLIEERPVSVLRLERPVDPPRLGAGALAQASRDLWAAVDEVAVAHGGLAVRQPNFCRQIYFGVPHTLGDEAEQATLAALRLRERHPGLRVALASGPMAVSLRPDGEWTGEVLAGAPLTVVRGLLDATRPEEILACPETTRAAADVADFAPKSERGGALVRRRHDPARPPPSALGRKGELASLLAAADRVAAGHGGLIVLDGEPGTGKSALAEAFRRVCAERGLDCRLAPCPRHPGMPDALAAMAAALGADQATPRSVGQTLTKLTAERPLVLLLDDAHAAERPALALVKGALAARLVLLLVVAGRSRGMRGWRELPGASHLRLGRLDERAIEAIIRDHAPAPLDAATVAGLCERARGVPLFARELGRSAGLGRLPFGLWALISSRLDSVRANRALLHLVAARPVTPLDRLAAMWRGATPDLDLALSHCREAGVLQDVETVDGAAVEFAHPLLGEAVWQSVLAADREAILVRFAEV